MTDTPSPLGWYRRCEDGCTHDLAHGVLTTAELCGEDDGPYPPTWVTGNYPAFGPAAVLAALLPTRGSDG